MSKKKTIKKIHLGILFFTGLVLFFVGIIGYIFRLFMWVPVDISEVLPSQTNLLITLDTKQLNDTKIPVNLSKLSNLLPEIKNTSYRAEDIKPWIGKKAGIAILDNGAKVLVITYRSKKEVRNFLKRFTTEGEDFIIQKYEEGELLTPAFSSTISFGFYHDWLVVGTNPKIVSKIFTKERALKNEVSYKKIITDIPHDHLLFLFSNTNELIKNITIPSKYEKYQPLLITLSQSLPFVGLSLQTQQDKVTLSSKILTNKDIFNDQKIPKVPNKNIPNLANLVPHDVLLFINGYDLNQKYLHTKDFLEKLEPQFSVIFEGVLTAQVERLFGKGLDLQRDLLAHINKDYAFMLDIQDSEKPFINLSFIAQTSSQAPSKIESAIRKSVSQSVPVIEKLTLPNGKVREELTLAEKRQEVIASKSIGSYKYFTTSNTESDSSVAYAFLDNNFIVSLNEEGLKSIIQTQIKQKKNLTENPDFRESLLFQFSPSPSYGFVNLSKLEILTTLWENNKKDSMVDFLEKHFRSFTFSRKVFPGEIFVKAIFFQK